jgi:hypothetical protein
MLLLNRITKTRTADAAWDLADRLTKACPFNEFVVVIEERGGGPVVHAVGAFHPIDQVKAKEVVRGFVEEKLARA